jgi:hypothetical protein
MHVEQIFCFVEGFFEFLEPLVQLGPVVALVSCFNYQLKLLDAL